MEPSESAEPIKALQDAIESVGQSPDDEVSAALSQARDALEAALTQLREQQTHAEHNRNALHAAWEPVREMLAAIPPPGEAAKLEAALAENGERLRTIEARLDEAQSDAEAAQRRASALEAQLADKDQEIARLKEEQADRGEVETLETRLDEAQSDAEAAQRRASALETQLADKDQALAKLREELVERAELEALEGRLGEAQAEIKTAQQRASALETQLGDKDEALAKLEAELAARGDAKALEADVARLKGDKENLEQALKNARDELDTLRAELDAERAAQAREHEQTLANAARERDAAQAEMESLKAEIAARPSNETLERLEQELAKERARADDLAQRLEEEIAKGTKSALAEQLAEALRETEQARAELRALRAEGGPAARVEPEAAISGLRPGDDELTRIQRAAARSGATKKRSIGEILSDAGVISASQLEDAIEEQRGDAHKHLGAILIAKGYASAEAVAQALACQCDAPFVRIADDAVDTRAVGLITQRLAQQHACVPLRSDKETIQVAMFNPMDLVAIEDIERATGRKVDLAVATASDIEAAIEKYYWEPE